MTTFLALLAGMQIGFTLCYFVLGKTLIEPLIKNNKIAGEGWKDSIDLLAKLVGIEADGSIKSPIQIEKV